MLVSAAQSVCIPPYHEALVPIKYPQACNGKTILLETIPSFNFKPLATARSFSKVVDGYSVCKIANYPTESGVNSRPMPHLF